MEKTIASITQRVKDWKSLFIEKANFKNVDGLTEESTWVDIMKNVPLNSYELFKITMEASCKFGFFSDEEEHCLQRLSWYRVVVDMLPQIDTKMPDGSQFHIGIDPSSYNVCFIYHKKNLDVFECYIIAPEIAEVMKTDLLISYVDIGKVACVSFVKEIPKHFNVQ